MARARRQRGDGRGKEPAVALPPCRYAPQGPQTGDSGGTLTSMRGALAGAGRLAPASDTASHIKCSIAKGKGSVTTRTGTCSRARRREQHERTVTRGRTRQGAARRVCNRPVACARGVASRRATPTRGGPGALENKAGEHQAWPKLNGTLTCWLQDCRGRA